MTTTSFSSSSRICHTTTTPSAQHNRSANDEGRSREDEDMNDEEEEEARRRCWSGGGGVGRVEGTRRSSQRQLLAVIGLFGLAVPILVYKGIVREFHMQDEDVGGPYRKFLRVSPPVDVETPSRLQGFGQGEGITIRFVPVLL
ncbi:hypothetical protein ZWY2020_023540 [Hordeum vulgare]|nr:hypothetical protein ZWY2020_023540 [Hordeum vulgare]